MGVRLEAEPADQLARPRLGDIGRDTPQPGDEFEELEGRQLVVDHRLVGDPGDVPLGRDRIGERVDAEHRDLAGVGTQQPGDDPQGGGLAGPVGTEQGVELPGPDRQVEAIDRRPVEVLDEAPKLQGGHGDIHGGGWVSRAIAKPEAGSPEIQISSIRPQSFGDIKPARGRTGAPRNRRPAWVTAGREAGREKLGPVLSQGRLYSSKDMIYIQG